MVGGKIERMESGRFSANDPKVYVRSPRFIKYHPNVHLVRLTLILSLSILKSSNTSEKFLSYLLAYSQIQMPSPPNVHQVRLEHTPSFRSTQRTSFPWLGKGRWGEVHARLVISILSFKFLPYYILL